MSVIRAQIRTHPVNISVCDRSLRRLRVEIALQTHASMETTAGGDIGREGDLHGKYFTDNRPPDFKIDIVMMQKLQLEPAGHFGSVCPAF
jgi:hypothetical protein